MTKSPGDQRKDLQTGPVVSLGAPYRDSGKGVVATFTYAPPGQPWTASGELTRSTAGLVIDSLTIRPRADSQNGVTSGMLRKIQLGEILAAVRSLRNAEALGRAAQDAPTADQEEPKRRGGRAPLTSDLLRDVALTYLRETASGMPSGAVKRMAAKFGRPEETIRTWITRARRDGWLGPSVKGRPGAEPGWRLLVGDKEAPAGMRPEQEPRRES